MLKNRQLSFALMLCLSAALVLSACTRQATTDTVLPTDTPADGSGGGGNPDQAATDAFVTNMNATLIAGNTQTAEAILGNGTGGGGDGLVGTATPTPAGIIDLPTATPASIPATSAPAPTASTGSAGGATTYTVQPGDWLYKIARNLGVTPAALIAANPQINPNAVLQPGTVLNIPGAGGTGTGGGDGGTGAKTYTVVLGDNLFRIALNHGTNYQTLAQLNNIPAPYTVYPGQVLNLP